MYEAHFGLRENPFSSSPSPEFIYQSREHREALAHFQYAITNREPFVLLTGEVGTGKTTAIQALRRFLPSGTPVAFVGHTTLEPRELLEEIALRFGLDTQSGESKPSLMRRLESFLEERVRAKGPALLVFDEAHLMSVPLLEEVRLLSNLESVHGGKLLQICLVGQPELERHLQSIELRQLRQRISLRYSLHPLSREDTGAYIHHRLRAAGSPDPAGAFPDEAIAVVFALSQGIPREINVLAAQALLNAFLDDAVAVNRRHVLSAKSDYGFEGIVTGAAALSPEAEALPPQLDPLPAPRLDPLPAPRREPAQEPDPLLEWEEPAWMDPAYRPEAPPPRREPALAPDRAPGPPPPPRRPIPLPPATLRPPVRERRQPLPRPGSLPAAEPGSRGTPVRVRVSAGAGARARRLRGGRRLGWIFAGALVVIVVTGLAFVLRDRMPSGGDDLTLVATAPPGASEGMVRNTPIVAAPREQTPRPASEEPLEGSGPPVADVSSLPPAAVEPAAAATGQGLLAIQVASFRTRERADAVLLAATEKTGLRGAVLPTDVNGVPWYRILLGAFASEAEARRAAQPLIEDRMITSVAVRPIPADRVSQLSGAPQF